MYIHAVEACPKQSNLIRHSKKYYFYIGISATTEPVNFVTSKHCSVFNKTKIPKIAKSHVKN